MLAVYAEIMENSLYVCRDYAGKHLLYWKNIDEKYAYIGENVDEFVFEARKYVKNNMPAEHKKAVCSIRFRSDGINKHIENHSNLAYAAVRALFVAAEDGALNKKHSELAGAEGVASSQKDIFWGKNEKWQEGLKRRIKRHEETTHRNIEHLRVVFDVFRKIYRTGNYREQLHNTPQEHKTQKWFFFFAYLKEVQGFSYREIYSVLDLPITQKAFTSRVARFVHTKVYGEKKETFFESYRANIPKRK